jgi:hypothetical protein
MWFIRHSSLFIRAAASFRRATRFQQVPVAMLLVFDVMAQRRSLALRKIVAVGAE